MALAGVLIIKQPDLGTTIVIGCITFSMLFAAGVRIRTLVVPGMAVLRRRRRAGDVDHLHAATA